jgi:hypothetical protein
VQSHQRSFSNVSVESFSHGGITLQDNTDGTDSKNEACWAKSVHIEDYVIVNASRTNIGAFVVWNIIVETLRASCSLSCQMLPILTLFLQGGTMRVRKRYSEFDDLRQKLIQTFPYSEGALPPLPPKSVISKFRPQFLEHRRAGIQYFLKYFFSELAMKYVSDSAQLYTFESRILEFPGPQRVLVFLDN